MARLKSLSDTERKQIAELVARGYSVAEARRYFYSHNEYIPENNWYDYPSVLAYIRSSQGEKEVAEAKSHLRSKAGDLPYVHRGERLAVLRENLDRLLGRIRKSDAMDSRELVSLSSETRQVIREIREEAFPYDTETSQVKSYFQEFMEALSSLDPETSKLINETGVN